MHLSFAVALVGIVAATPINRLRDATSAASPLTVPHDTSPPLMVRQNSGDGNVKIDFSKAEIRWGDQPPWHVAARMHDACDTSGCDGQFTHKTTFVDNEFRKREVDLIVDTGPSHYADWLKQGLANLIVWSLQQDGVVRIERKQHWTTGCIGFQCQGSKDEFYDQYYATRRVQAEYYHDDGHISVMQFDVRDNSEETGKEGCKDTWSAAGVFAGLVPVFGGLFTLLTSGGGIGCS